MNADAVDRILESISIPLQLGGGIRNTATVEAWLEKGVTRVIIGTAAVRDPPFVKQAARDYPGQVAVGLDARDGKVAVEGWAETSELTRAGDRASVSRTWALPPSSIPTSRATGCSPD